MRCTRGVRVFRGRPWSSGVQLLWWIKLPESPGHCDLSVVLVRWIDEGGLAEVAGRRIGDVLLEFNGQAIRDSGLLRQMLASHDCRFSASAIFGAGVVGDAVFTAKGEGL